MVARARAVRRPLAPRIAGGAALLLPPAPAAAAPVTRVAVGPDRAVSLTLTLPRNGKVVVRAGQSSRRLTASRDRIVVGGETFDRGRDPRAQRLVMSRTAGITTVGLGPETLLSAPARTVTVEGQAKLTDRYASSARDPLDRLGQRFGMLHAARPRDVSYLGQGVDGDLQFRGLRSWSAAFVPGVL